MAERTQKDAAALCWMEVVKVLPQKQHEGYFGTDLVTLNRGQLMGTTPELAHPLQASLSHQREEHMATKYDLERNRPHTGGSSVESGFEPGVFRPEAMTLPLGHRGPFGQ
ncbi:hypothetical protein AVEN_126333-1 [Araneus ventricosus]|uniref:Uncharacterized protein n=1 Tax=Araneus ventricosus TaxID=182803 RepID=A0A4Y2T792_ARAVE|nr:hypothetical protein AVEN_126333-1 [Araneus ventricosus]